MTVGGIILGIIIGIIIIVVISKVFIFGVMIGMCIDDSDTQDNSKESSRDNFVDKATVAMRIEHAKPYTDYLTVRGRVGEIDAVLYEKLLAMPPSERTAANIIHLL